MQFPAGKPGENKIKGELCPLPHKNLKIYALEIPPFRPRRHADRPDAGHHPLGAVRPAALRDRSRGPDDALSLYRTAAAGFVPRILRHDLRPSRRGVRKIRRILQPSGNLRKQALRGNSRTAVRPAGAGCDAGHRHLQTRLSPGISGSATVSRSSAAERPTVPARPKRA